MACWDRHRCGLLDAATVGHAQRVDAPSSGTRPARPFPYNPSGGGEASHGWPCVALRHGRWSASHVRHPSGTRAHRGRGRSGCPRYDEAWCTGLVALRHPMPHCERRACCCGGSLGGRPSCRCRGGGHVCGTDTLCGACGVGGCGASACPSLGVHRGCSLLLVPYAGVEEFSSPAATPRGRVFRPPCIAFWPRARSGSHGGRAGSIPLAARASGAGGGERAA